jgi:chromate transporter
MLKSQVSGWALLRAWLAIGLNSFGGGTVTLFLIRRLAVETHGWYSAAEFTRDWGLVQAAPGINLLAITILIGHRVAGFIGSLIALFGLMLPSVTINIVLAAMYAQFRTLPAIDAAIKGVIPATVGLGLLMCVNMARPLLEHSHAQGRLHLGGSIGILLFGALALVVLKVPVFGMLLGAGVAGAFIAVIEARRRSRAEVPA